MTAVGVAWPRHGGGGWRPATAVGVGWPRYDGGVGWPAPTATVGWRGRHPVSPAAPSASPLAPRRRTIRLLPRDSPRRAIPPASAGYATADSASAPMRDASASRCTAG